MTTPEQERWPTVLGAAIGIVTALREDVAGSSLGADTIQAALAEHDPAELVRACGVLAVAMTDAVATARDLPPQLILQTVGSGLAMIANGGAEGVE